MPRRILIKNSFIGSNGCKILTYLLEIFENATEETTFTMQRINTALDRTWGYGCYRANIGSIVPCLSILKYLELCIQKFLRNKRG